MLDNEDNRIDQNRPKTKLISNIRKNQNKPELYDASFSLFEDREITFKHFGKIDENGNFHGYTILKVSPSASCIKGGKNLETNFYF